MILVTGATGNVGGALVRDLAARGVPVRAIVRDPARRMPDGIEAAPGDLNDPASLRDAFADVPIATIDPADIAAVAAEALLGDGHDGLAYPLTGPAALRPAERLAVLGDVLQRPLTFEAEPNEDARARMLAAMPERYVDAFFSFFVDGTLDETTVQPTVAEVTGRPARTFREWAEENAEAFRR